MWVSSQRAKPDTVFRGVDGTAKEPNLKQCLVDKDCALTVESQRVPLVENRSVQSRGCREDNESRISTFFLTARLTSVPSSVSSAAH